MPAVIGVGHKGADAIEPGNTLASFDVAVAHGVDMIEFDVLPEDPREPARSPLRLAHDYHDLSRAPTLEEALAHLAGPASAGVQLDVDLKLAGYERRVVGALRDAGLLQRTLVSSQLRRSLATIRVLEPSLRVGWSVPRARRDYRESPWLGAAARASLAAGRHVLPGLAARALRVGRCDAIMAFHPLITPALVRAVRRTGGELYAWTVDDAPTIDRLRELGVHGVITNDPRLLKRAAGPEASGVSARGRSTAPPRVDR